MTLSHRELMLGWITGFILLYAGTFVLCKPYIDTWRQKQEEQAGLEMQIADAREFLEQKAGWETRLDELRKHIGPLGSERAAANYLQKVIGDMAGRVNGQADHTINFRNRKAGEETTHGGLHMIPVTCTWDGNTPGIVNLLIDFLNSEVMFDATELVIRSTGRDRLKGTFTVNCIFTRSTPGEGSE